MILATRTTCMCFPVLRARLVRVLLARAVGAVFDLLDLCIKNPSSIFRDNGCRVVVAVAGLGCYSLTSLWCRNPGLQSVQK